MRQVTAARKKCKPPDFPALHPDDPPKAPSAEHANRNYMVLKTWLTTYNCDSVLHSCVSQPFEIHRPRQPVCIGQLGS